MVATMFVVVVVAVAVGATGPKLKTARYGQTGSGKTYTMRPCLTKGGLANLTSTSAAARIGTSVSTAHAGSIYQQAAEDIFAGAAGRTVTESRRAQIRT